MQIPDPKPLTRSNKIFAAFLLIVLTAELCVIGFLGYVIMQTFTRTMLTFLQIVIARNGG